jgi:hypothetical protein
MTLRILGAGGGAVLAAALTASPAAATTAIDGQVFLQTIAQVNQDPSVPAFALDNWGVQTPGAFHDLGKSQSATATGGPDNKTGATVSGQISAHWDSADGGSVDVEHGWTVFAGQDALDQHVQVTANSQFSDENDWDYHFTATRDSTIRLSGEIQGGGDNDFGLGGWRVSFHDLGETTAFFPLLTTVSPGSDDQVSFEAQLLAGHSYRIGLESRESALFIGAIPHTAEERAHFTWSIDSGGVPEPSTWALSIAGCGLAGAALRRRHAAERGEPGGARAA